MAGTQRKDVISTAGCLIIGDEILGGKAYFAKWCFSSGIHLRRIEVIADDEGEIVEAARRMSKQYDLVVTSGGIGPTCVEGHDDITYPSIAKAFGLPLQLHAGAFERMKALSKPDKSQAAFDWNMASAALTAKKRMVELPMDEAIADEQQVLFVSESLWVPVSCVNGNVYILPGVPQLFEAMLEGLKLRLVPRLADGEGRGMVRILISTPLAESAVAEYLGEVAVRAEARGVKVGSYPRWGKDRNTVTLVGRDGEFIESLVGEVEQAVQGRRVTVEGEDEIALSEEEE